MSDGFIIKRGGGGGDSNAAFKAMVTRSITEVTADMLQGITIIGDGAFAYVPMTSIEIPNSVTSIGEAAFVMCERLTSIEIPNSVTSIERSAFSNCESLASITIPNSVTNIGGEVFLNCNSLASVTVEATNPPTLGSSIFSGTDANLTIYVPAESVDTYKAASGWSNYASKIQAILSEQLLEF